MMLTALALALTPDALACLPEEPAIVAQAPAHGQQGVPRDALIRFQVSGGEPAEPVEITVTIDGEPVPGTLHTLDPDGDPLTQAPLYTFDPDGDLPEQVEVDVRVDGLGPAPTAFTFQTGVTRIGEGAPQAPRIHSIDAWDGEDTSDERSMCDPTHWRDLYMSIETVEEDIHQLGFVVAYRLGPEGELDEADPLITHGSVSGGLLDLYAELFGKQERAIEDECFVAVAFDGAGNASEASEVVCARRMPEWRCGTGLGMFGCSSAPLTAALAPAVLALVGAGVRRREDA